MECQKKSLFDFLNGAGRGSSNVQFTIPIYQRNYAWERTHCDRLLQDVFDLSEKLRNGILTTPHFCGSIVYSKNTLYNQTLGNINNCDVVDGQQRLTTLSLIIKALYDIGVSLPSASVAFKTGVLPQFEERLYLSIHSKVSGFKMSLHTNDDSEFVAIMNSVTLTPIVSIRLRDNYAFINDELKKYICSDENKITHIRNALQQFEICWIELDVVDNPQDIFETLNSLGKELNIGDLVRNYILMQIPSNLLSIYYPKWCKIEKNCGCNETALNNFISAFLIYHNDTNKGIVDNTRILYSCFKKYSDKILTGAMSGGRTKIDGLNNILDELQSLSEIYGYLIGTMASGTSPYGNYINQAFDDLRRLKISTVYPFIMHLAIDYKDNKIIIADFENVIKFMVTHIVRKAFMGGSFKSLNSFFAVLYKNIFGVLVVTPNNYLDVLGTYFLHNSLIVVDSDFEVAVVTKPIYDENRSLTAYVLSSIENCGVATLAHVGTIEHILPQSGDAAGAWETDLGGKQNLDKVRNTYVHTLGNLTLLIPNSALGAKSFQEKLIDYNNPTMCKASVLLKGVTAVSPIPPATVPIWNETTIVCRAKNLANIMINGISALGSAKAISPLFAYPNFTFLGSVRFSEVFANPKLLSKGIYGYRLFNGAIVELSSKKKPLRELYNSLISHLYNNGYQAQMDALALNGGIRLLSKTSKSNRLKHIIDSVETMNTKTAKSYMHTGNIYYYNNFSFFDETDIIQNLLFKLSIPLVDLVLYIM